MKDLRLACVLAEVQTGHLLNTSQQFYHLNGLLSEQRCAATLLTSGALNGAILTTQVI
jgi:hypothetical protein